MKGVAISFLLLSKTLRRVSCSLFTHRMRGSQSFFFFPRVELKFKCLKPFSLHFGCPANRILFVSVVGGRLESAHLYLFCILATCRIETNLGVKCPRVNRTPCFPVHFETLSSVIWRQTPVCLAPEDPAELKRAKPPRCNHRDAESLFLLLAPIAWKRDSQHLIWSRFRNLLHLSSDFDPKLLEPQRVFFFFSTLAQTHTCTRTPTHTH